MTPSPYRGLIARYREFLPVGVDSIVTLHEGATPLLPCLRLGDRIGTEAAIFLKFEGLNPTGSFKDRGMTYAISRALDAGSRAVICASTGNTSASASAYAARAGLDCTVIIPKGKIAYGKLSQAIQHGAKVIQIAGNFDAALRLVLELAEKLKLTVVNSVNPDRLRGQMTAAFEVAEDLGATPDYHFLPVGNAGNITAYWMGYRLLKDSGKTAKLPRMMGVQAKGAAPIVKGKPVANPETVASAIRIGNPASWKQAIAARDESGGSIFAVTDSEILKAYRLVAELEGYFCEPASAASVAGLIRFARENRFTKGEKIVCTLTGHGLKDPDTAVKAGLKPVSCRAEAGALMKLIAP